MGVELKVKRYLEEIKKRDKKINSFLELNPKVLEEAREVDKKKKKGKLAGYVVGIKSNINVSGLTASCGSKTLENYKSTYDASVIQKIKAEDGVIIGMLNCDEFAAGASGENSAFGATENPIVPGHVSGGSSSGSAAAVSAGFCDVALGSDTGGSIRTPASFCGVVGVKPSYGSVSRYGLIDLSMSLDQIGPIAKNVKDAKVVFDVISGKDEKDSTTFFKREDRKISKAVKFGIFDFNADKKIKDAFSKILDKISNELKWKSSKVSLKHIDLAVQTYHPIVWTEFFSATRRFDGRKYGKVIEESAGEEVLRRIYGGSEISKAEFKGEYYKKALGVKQKISQEFDNAFEGIDCMLSPTVPILPWKIGQKMSLEQLYNVDVLAIPANLAGICALSLPVGTIEGKPFGLQIMCPRGCEKNLFEIATKLESSLNNIHL